MDTLLFMLMGIYGLFAVAITLAYVMKYNDIKIYHVILLVTGVAAFSASIVLTGMTVERHQPSKVHSTKFKVTTSIHQELLDGKIVSTDTIYTFIPKKK